jgi:hypothetical protein
MRRESLARTASGILLDAMILSLLLSSFSVVLAMPEGAREPQIAIGTRRFAEPPDCLGRFTKSFHADVFVACGTKTGVYVCASSDSGATFGPATEVASVAVLSLGMRRGPRVAVSGGSVVVTAIAGEQGGGRDGDLLCWRSTDDGRTWSSASRINATAGSTREGLHGMAAGIKQDLFCAWIDLSGDTPRICGSVSMDAGVRWSPPIPLTGESDRICPCCHPSVTIDAGGRIWVMWRGDADGARDMFVVSSSDQGASFSLPAKVGTGSWKLQACPMDGGSIAASLGRTTTVWRRDRTVFRAEPAGPEVRLGEGEQPWITAGPAGFYCTWLERRGGALELWSTGLEVPFQLDEHANDPAIASSESSYAPVIAVWESGEGDRQRIVAARIDGKPGAK